MRLKMMTLKSLKEKWNKNKISQIININVLFALLILGNTIYLKDVQASCNVGFYNETPWGKLVSSNLNDVNITNSFNGTDYELNAPSYAFMQHADSDLNRLRMEEIYKGEFTLPDAS